MSETQESATTIPVRLVRRDCQSCGVKDIGKRLGACAWCATLVTDGQGNYWAHIGPLPNPNGEVIQALPKHLAPVPQLLLVE